MWTNNFIPKILLALFGHLASKVEDNAHISLGGEIISLISEYIDPTSKTVQYGDLEVIKEVIEKELSFRHLKREEKEGIKNILLEFLLYNFPDQKTIVQCNNDSQKLSKALCNGFSERYTTLGTYESETCYRCLSIIAEVYIQMAQKTSAFNLENWRLLFSRVDELKKSNSSLNNSLHDIADIQNNLINDFNEFVQYVKNSTDFSSINQLCKKHEKYVEFENRYLDVISRKYNVINLFASLIHRSYKSYNLSVAYVDLWLEIGERDSKKVDPIELLNRDKHIWIAGDPGYGKTTLLQWMAVNFAEDKFLSPALKHKIPVFVTLRNIKDFELFGIEKAIQMSISEIESTVPDGWIVDMLNHNRFVLLLDGMDEISSGNADTVKGRIESLVESYRNIRVIISARTYVEADLKFSCTYARIKKMDEEQILKFIDYWHNSVIVKPGILDSKDVTRYKENLYNSILSIPSISKLAEVPLACAMLCALNFCKNNCLPHTRRQLYEDCCRTFLEIDPLKDIKLGQYPKLSIEDYNLILDGLAYWMLRNGYIEAKIDIFEKQIGNRLRLMGIENIQSKEVVRYLTERSGIIRKVGVDSVEFIHKTFMEFMAARELQRQSDWGVLQQHFEDNDWQETIILSSSLASKNEAEKLIESLINSTRWTLTPEKSKIKAKRYFMAKACLENIQIIDKSYRDRVDDELKKFIPVANTTMAQALAGSGTWCIPYLTYEARYTDDECKNNILTLNFIDSLQIIPTLFTYLSEDVPGNIRFVALETWLSIQKRAGAGKHEEFLMKKIRKGDSLCIPFSYFRESRSDESLLLLLQGVEELQVERYSGEVFLFPFGYRSTIKELILLGNYPSIGISRQFFGLKKLVLDHFSNVLCQIIEELPPDYRPQKLVLPSNYANAQMPNGVDVEFDDNRIQRKWS